MSEPQLEPGEKFNPYPIRARIDNPISKETKQKIDEQVKSRAHIPTESLIQKYDRLPKRNGFVNARQFLA